MTGKDLDTWLGYIEENRCVAVAMVLRVLKGWTLVVEGGHQPPRVLSAIPLHGTMTGTNVTKAYVLLTLPRIEQEEHSSILSIYKGKGQMGSVFMLLNVCKLCVSIACCLQKGYVTVFMEMEKDWT